MRGIKFRAWNMSKDNYMKLHGYLGNTFWDNGELCTVQATIILEQFTGLRDKSGKEIYEGDIVRDYDEGFLYKVMFCEYHARFMFYDYLNDDYYDNQDIAEHEVIGNIHETQELLK